MRDEIQEITYANALNQIRQLGPARFGRLRKHFTSLRDAWQAPLSELQKAGLEPAVAEAVVVARREISPEIELAALREADIEVLLIDSPAYPTLLRQIHNAPVLLYVRGSLKAVAATPAVAIVGTRKMTPYGRQVAHTFAAQLARAGANIISGLASGIDGEAHAGALSVQGLTVGVLGCGLDDATIYPAEHRALAQKIVVSGGAIISELPIATPPLKMHFPFRNRIIAGLSSGCVVVEADEQSGSLITASAALDYNREVFVVPGSVFSPTSRGTNHLLLDGARPALSAEQILQDLGLGKLQQEQQARAILPETPEEEKLLNLLSTEPLHINALIATSGLSPGEVASTLTMMELRGKVRNLGAMQYVKAR